MCTFPPPSRERIRRLASLLASRSWRGGGSKRLGDMDQDAFDVSQNFVVPEPQHPIADTFEPRGPPFIGLALAMLTTIDLDDQSRLLTNEIGNVTSNRLLPSPLRFRLACAQLLPEPALGIGHVPTQAFRMPECSCRISAQATSPSGASHSCLNACISAAPSAPSIARWSKLPVALITVEMASASSTT